MIEPLVCVCGEAYLDETCFAAHYRECSQSPVNNPGLRDAQGDSVAAGRAVAKSADEGWIQYLYWVDADGERHEGWHPAMLAKGLAEAPPPSDVVLRPQNAEQAELMQKAGYQWLKDNAPERLAPPPREPSTDFEMSDSVFDRLGKMLGRPSHDHYALVFCAEAKLRELMTKPPSVPDEATPAMLKAAQKHTDIGTVICSDWPDAYDCLSELWRVMLSAAKQEQSSKPADGEKTGCQSG